MTISLARVVAGALATSAAYVGLWAMVGPRSFCTTFPGLGQAWVAPFGSYNEHLVRDVGSLYVALLVFSGWAAAKGDTSALRALGWTWLAFALPHLAFHATHRNGLSTGAWASSLASLTLVAVGAAMLVLVRADDSVPTADPVAHTEEIR